MHTLALRLRPRISLASGGVLVLLTLFLPIGYEACGPPHPGYELAGGQGEWPTFLGILSSAAGRDFYLLALSLGVFAIFFVFLSFLRPNLRRKRSLIHRLFALTGTVSLFLIADTYLLLAALAADWHSAAAFALLLVPCLSPGLVWPKKGFLAWVSVLAISMSLLFIAAALDIAPDNWILLCFEAVYTLVPLGLWYGFGFSLRADARSQWESVRRGLVAFYFPAVLGNLWFLRIAVAEHVWGFVPCYFGIHLMALGYLRLAQEGIVDE